MIQSITYIRGEKAFGPIHAPHPPTRIVLGNQRDHVSGFQGQLIYKRSELIWYYKDKRIILTGFRGLIVVQCPDHGRLLWRWWRRSLLRGCSCIQSRIGRSSIGIHIIQRICWEGSTARRGTRCRRGWRHWRGWKPGSGIRRLRGWREYSLRVLRRDSGLTHVDFRHLRLFLRRGLRLRILWKSRSHLDSCRLSTVVELRKLDRWVRNKPDLKLTTTLPGSLFHRVLDAAYCKNWTSF